MEATSSERPSPGGFPDPEVAVVRFARQAVLEYHQGAHHVGALHVADVDALDPQRRIGQAQRVLNTLQRSGSGVEVTGPFQLVLLQCLFRVALHGFGQRPLIAAARHPQRDPGAAQTGQPTGQLVGVGRQTRNQHLAGNRVGGFVGGAVQLRLVAVELRQELLDQPLLAGITRVTGLFDDPAALTTNPATADVEHLHRRLELVVGERHHVGVGAVAEHHGLLLHRPLERAKVVTKAGGSFEIELVGRGVHPLFQLAGKPVGFAGQEVAEVCHDLAMLLGS